MNNGLLYLGGLLVIALSALFAVPNLVDWNGYRGVFEEEASKVLGRDVRVGGSVNLKLFPVPYMRFEKVRISNLTGQTGEAFVRADSFTMWLSAPALLRGVIEASEIELNKPMITLAVDANGGGNWSSIALKPGDLPFVPRDVALRSVKLRDGAISVYNAANERVAAVENIDGELSADGLRGPFRYKGAGKWSGTVHDVKLATETADLDGNFGLKLSARAETSPSPSVYTLDGQVSNLSLKPTFTGAWTAKLAVPASSQDDADHGAAPPLVDVKSQVTADALGAKFDDVVVSLDTTAAPQMVVGTATATWTSVPRLDVSLSSKWLDVDWLAGAGQGSASLSKVKDFAYGLMKSVAAEGTAAARIDLEQIKVGGETAGGLNIDAERRGTNTHFKTFKVSLPGGSRLDIAGDLKTDAGKMSFSGNVFVAGSSLARLKAWAGKSGMPIDIKADGAFSAGGKLDIDDTRIALADAAGEIGGRSMAGEFTRTRDGHDRIEVTLQAPEIDTSEVFPAAAAELHAIVRKAVGIAGGEADAKSPAALPGDMRLRVIAGRWTHEGETYRDVDFTFEREGNDFRLPAARLTTPAGLTVGLEGRIKTGTDTPSGTLAYDLAGATPEATRDIARLFSLSALFGETQLKALKDAKIAGLLRLGTRAPAAADVTFDGTLNGLGLVGSAEFDGGLNAWRSKPSRLQATVTAPSLPLLLATLGSGGSIEDNRGAGGPSEAFVATAGTIGESVIARADITSPDMTLAYAGRMTLPSHGAVTLDGSVDVKTNNMAAALALAGLPLPRGAAGVAGNGSLDIVRKEGAWTIAARGLSLGGTGVAGAVKIATLAGGRQRIEGKIGADRVNFVRVLAALTDKQIAEAPATPVPSTGPAPAATPLAPSGAVAGAASPTAPADAKPVWPDGVFNFAAFKNVDAAVDVSFGSLALSGNLATHDGSMAVKLSSGKLDVSNIDVDAAGGKLTGTFALDSLADGTALSTKLRLKDAKLASMSPIAKGKATLEFDATARAQSPAGLIGVLAGSGSIKTENAVVPGPAATLASDIVDTVLHGKLQNDPRTVSAALLAALETSAVDVGNRDIAARINDGTLKLETVPVETPDGKVDATAAVDLTSLGLSASCQVTALVKPLPPPPIPLPNYQPPAEKPPPPPALVLYNGRLDELSGVKPVVDVVELQRDLAVRQAERNVEQLKLARSVDEERFRLEKERRKKAEEDRLAAIAAARAKWLAEHAPPTAPPPVAPAVTAPAAAAAGAEAVPISPVPAAGDTTNAATPPPAVAGEAAAGGGQPSAAQNPADAPNGTTTSAPTITVEPIAPPAGTTTAGDPNAAASGVPPVIDPVTGLPIPPKTDAQKTYAPRPRSERSRTSSDEVRKSLGAFP